MEECHRLLTNQVDLVNPEGHRFVPDDLEYLISGDTAKKAALSISKLKAANCPDFGLKELVPSLWIESERDYNNSAACGITHWWFKRKEFYITRHCAPSDRSTVRSHMRILSIISLEKFKRYGYAFLREIVIHRASYKEYKISEADFKNLHPNDFEDLYLLHLQGKLNHLPGSNKVYLYNALDHMVKDFKLFEYNRGMENRIWSEDDKRRSEEFIEVIEIRLKIRRIFRSLKRFVGGRLRDVDYKLLQRT
ncbi:hypothetical protein Tco_1427936 [Tanacetum coccineum]